jgi:hypothetical protein
MYVEYTSHRSEAYGVLASLKTVHKIRQYQKRFFGSNKSMSVLLLCGNKSVVNSTNKFQRYGTTLKDCYSADYDIIGEIGRVWKFLQHKQLFIKIDFF